MKNRRIKTDFLFPTPSFIIGMGSAFNLFGNYYHYNTLPTGEEADARALRNDFEMVGQDIRAALNQIDSNEFTVY